MFPARYTSPGVATACTFFHKSIHLERALSICLVALDTSQILDRSPKIIRKNASGVLVVQIPVYIMIVEGILT
jgi:hypothetical protein